MSTDLSDDIAVDNVILIFRILRKNADVRQCSYLELELLVDSLDLSQEHEVGQSLV